MACGLVKEAVLRQILQHLLTMHSKEEDDHVLLLAEEQLDTLQALLEEEAPRVDKPPLLRSRVHTNTTPVESDHAEEPSTSNGREAAAMSSPSLTVDRQDRVTGAGANEDTRHVVQFMRRHGPGESLRIASSVLYATVGVIAAQGGRTNKTSLVRAIAGEIHSVARHLLHQRQLEDEGDQLQRGTNRLSAAEVVQWERHLADNEQEEEETAMTMMETGGEEPSEEGSQDSTPDSHRRRRLLTAHHKDFIGEDSRKSDDENCLMAMGRYDSNSSSQEEVPPANDRRS